MSTTIDEPLKAPFPYFGGKKAVSDLVWQYLGDPRNYVEPFAGSLAVLLRRPTVGQIETVNDANHFIVNFWRSVRADPEKVAYHADAPVTEADLHARHRYLMFSEEARQSLARVAFDPEAFDAKLAGWWVWGQCCWIGAGWCTSAALRSGGSDSREQIPELQHDSGTYGKGVVASAAHKRFTEKLPLLNADFDKAGTGIHAKLPAIDSRGMQGVHSAGEMQDKRPVLTTDGRLNRGVVGMGRPQLGDAFDIGRGVNANKYASTCEQRFAWLRDWMLRLADRLRLVRVCYGHWDRICSSHTTMGRLGDTGAFLDPPYAHDCARVQQWINHLLGDGAPPEATSASNRAKTLYAGDSEADIDRLVAEVNLWCREWGSKPEVRIVVCGYEGEHDSLESLGWQVVSWKAQGGYGNRREENLNKHRERLWLSPACVRIESAQRELF